MRAWAAIRALSLFTLVMGGASAALAAAAPAGDVEAGKAKAAACAACHGQDGASPIDPSYPNLAGQNANYLFRQLQMIKTQTRKAPLMIGQLDNSSEQDLADIAAYYASLPAKVGQTAAADAVLAKAEQIYRGGILDKGVAACAACHSPSGVGNLHAGFPAIGGQPTGYTIKQLTAYREGQRATDEAFGGMMRGVAAGLTDTEIAALAEYLRGLH